MFLVKAYEELGGDYCAIEGIGLKSEVHVDNNYETSNNFGEKNSNNM
jgi:hypothetical protein